MLHMGDQSADEYFSKIDFLVTLLSDLGSNVSEDEVFTYAINGLSDKYGSLAQIIAHKDPFPDLATMRSMVSTEEMRLWGDNHNTHNRDNRKPNTSTEPNAYGQETYLPQALNTMTLQEPADLNWNMDTAASSHLNSSTSNLSTIFNSCMYPSVLVGDGKSIPVTNTCHSTLLRQFICDNKCTIEFDEFGFSVKDLWTRQILLRCDSTGDLYPVTSPSYPKAFLLSQHTWHQRLGHPGSDMLRSLVSNNFISCNKTKSPVLCHACQLGKHRSLYGLKQAPRAWFQRFAAYAARVGFYYFRCDTSLFIYRHGADIAYLLLYVDDIVLTASSTTFLQRIITSLHAEFSMTDLGPLNYFLGVSVTRDTSGIAEAKYRGVANAVAETCWLRNLLRELHTSLSTATLVYCDNVSAVYLSSNPLQHQRTKHIEIDIHFVHDLVSTGHIRVLHVPSRYQYADIFTKGLPTALFDEFCSSLSVRSSPTQTARGC
uniref:Ribonuclease H-like domain-containing protein n=1 Tax=Tanacetum cinerariifolium TaxID=118510 RepID=A0A6L2KXI6_TANCI|nr:ribonuclease H-like domain-containing protein [Tanacetum cinerariifolium]